MSGNINSVEEKKPLISKENNEIKHQPNTIYSFVTIVHTLASIIFWGLFPYCNSNIRDNNIKNFNFMIIFLAVCFQLLISLIWGFGWGVRMIKLSNIKYYIISSLFSFAMLNFLAESCDPIKTRLDEQAILTFVVFIGYGITANILKVKSIKIFDNLINIIILCLVVFCLVINSIYKPSFISSKNYNVIYFFSHFFAGISSGIYEKYWIEQKEIPNFNTSLFYHSFGMFIWLIISAPINANLNGISINNLLDFENFFSTGTFKGYIPSIFILTGSIISFEITRIYIALRNRDISNMILIFSSLGVCSIAYVSHNKLNETDEKIKDEKYIFATAISFAIILVLVMVNLIRISSRHQEKNIN